MDLARNDRFRQASRVRGGCERRSSLQVAGPHTAKCNTWVAVNHLHRVGSWAAWIATAVLVYALLAWGASRQLYFPMPYPAGNWAARTHIGAEDVWVREGLHGWFARSPDAYFVTLHLHGNGGNITHRVLSAKHVLEAGSSVLLLDYRGYGRSSGRPTERGLYSDAEAAWDWLHSQGYQPEQIIVHGESLGTAVAAHLAVTKPCAGVVLEAPFTSARAVANRVLPLIGPALVWGYDTKRKVGDLCVPLLIIHGDQDEVIAYEFGKELYEVATGPKSFWTIPGATHNDLHLAGAPEFPRRLEAFYRSLAKRVVDNAQ
jgi:uncharacterized protein